MTYILSDSKIILSIKMAKFPMNSDLRNPLEGLGEKFLEPTKLYSLVTCPLAGIPSLCCLILLCGKNGVTFHVYKTMRKDKGDKFPHLTSLSLCTHLQVGAYNLTLNSAP